MKYIAGEDIEIGDMVYVDRITGLLMKLKKDDEYYFTSFNNAEKDSIVEV